MFTTSGLFFRPSVQVLFDVRALAGPTKSRLQRGRAWPLEEVHPSEADRVTPIQGGRGVGGGVVKGDMVTGEGAVSG